MFANIHFIDCIYFSFNAVIAFAVLFGLCQLSLLKIKTPETNNLNNVIALRKNISYKIMNSVTMILVFLLSTTISAILCFTFLEETFLLEETSSENTSTESFFVDTVSSFNFHTVLNSSIIFWQILVVFTAIVILLGSHLYLRHHQNALMEFPILKALAVFFLCCLISSNDLFVAFITIVGFSLSTYVLILSNPDNKSGCEAGIRYFYLSALSSGLIAFSLWITYLLFLSLNLIVIEDTLKEWNIFLDGSSVLILILICFLSFGLFFKLAAFPCHIWAAAVYEGSPQPIMAFFVLPIKIAVLAFVFKLFYATFKDVHDIYSYIFWFASLFSMIVGALSALVEKRIKKFFAYSSINQMGFLLIGTTVGTADSLQAASIYLVLYTIMNVGWFVILLSTFEVQTKRPLMFLSDLTYVAKNNMKSMVLFLFILFSMAGLPPLGGFFGKFYLLLEASTQNYYSLVLVGLITTLISTYYYLCLVKHILFDFVDATSISYQTLLFPTFNIILILVVLLLSGTTTLTVLDFLELVNIFFMIEGFLILKNSFTIEMLRYIKYWI
jgi:NADH-quinone oxidoreductase subunit N